MPVLLLSAAVVISALIGLDLSDRASTRGIADQLGCTPISRGTSATGVTREICNYDGDRIIIWSFSRGSNVVFRPSWVANGVVGPAWIIGCADVVDCVAIRHRIGGQLLLRGWIASAVEIL